MIYFNVLLAIALLLIRHYKWLINNPLFVICIHQAFICVCIYMVAVKVLNRLLTVMVMKDA